LTFRKVPLWRGVSIPPLEVEIAASSAKGEVPIPPLAVEIGAVAAPSRLAVVIAGVGVVRR
jgi:hypothetical protein